jgi:hypothetical protein
MTEKDARGAMRAISLTECSAVIALTISFEETTSGAGIRKSRALKILDWVLGR